MVSGGETFSLLLLFQAEAEGNSAAQILGNLFRQSNAHVQARTESKSKFYLRKAKSRQIQPKDRWEVRDMRKLVEKERLMKSKVREGQGTWKSKQFPVSLIEGQP